MSETVLAPPERFNFAQHLRDLNKDRLDRVAYIDDLASMSYRDLFDRVERCASALRSLGLRKEERVLLLMQDCIDWPVCFLGALHAGVVPVAVNTLLTADDYAHMLVHSRAQAALISGSLLPTLQAAMEKSAHELRSIVVSRQDPSQGALPAGAFEFSAWLNASNPYGPACDVACDDAAFWLYSSGSTGRPKGTVHTHGNLYWTAELFGRPVLGLTEDDVTFSAAKLFFAYGLGNSLTFPLSVGATAVLMADRPTPEACFKRMTAHKPTVFFGAPTGYAAMLASKDLPRRDQVALRMCASASEALPREIGERFTAHFGAEIVDGIGSTEMLHVYLSNRPGDVRYGTTGTPVPGYDIELRDEAGQVVTANEQVGDLYIKGPSSALMYWGNRAKSRETFQGAWTKSGDKYLRDKDGYYVYAGRADDMLKVSGQYVSPFEVESTLMQHPEVLEAAVIGVNDSNGLTKAKAFVVLKQANKADEFLADELKAFVKSKLAPVKYPRIIEFVAELPKTATGKIQRFRLRDTSTLKRE